MFYRLTLFAIIGLFACSCTTSRHITGSFDGFKKKITADTLVKDTRIMIVHGTGIKELNYADNFVNNFMDRLAGDYTIAFRDTINLGTNAGEILVKKYVFGEETIRFYILNWSGVTNRYKEWLLDNYASNKNGLKPAGVNKNLKQNIMIENLSDFVLYSGHLKDSIRYPFKQCMRLMFASEDQYNEFEDKKGEIKYNALYEFKATNRNIYLITGSLGSKITLDMLYDQENSELDFECDSIVCDFFFKQLKGIYMLSNQVPLLSLYYMTGGIKDVDKEYKEYVYQNYYGLCNYLENNPSTGKMDYVAFNDPNDILGYKLIDDKPFCNCADNDTDCIEAQKRINKVMCSMNNTGVFFKLFSKPNKAHMGCWDNRNVIKFLVDGVN